MNNINVIYEDNHIIVVEKPVNILSQKDISNDIDMVSFIKEYIKKRDNKPGNVYLGLVHRLDRPVGGIMVFAKTSKAASRLNVSIRNNEFYKTYLAVVDGELVNKKDTLENYLYKDEKTGTSKVVDKEYIGAKKAILEYKVIKYFSEGNKSLVKINLITGRHHQIRLQFLQIGNPIYGDQRYNKGPKIPINLWAYKLSFKHPIKDEVCLFKCFPKWNILENIKEKI